MKIPTFLKWAGGKRKVINQIGPYLPDRINTYFEPFLGGGAMFFYIKQKYDPKSCTLSDINEDLIASFTAVRDEPKNLIKHIKSFKNLNSKQFYYKTRDRFNNHKISGIRRSAAFIYLNKTCFNGLWRVNSKNEFNVPYGKHKNPEIFNEETILFASQLLQGVEIVRQDYREILKEVKRGDFVYLDPCYDPLKKTSFANYNPKRFCPQDRMDLARFIALLNGRNINFLLSNNDLPEIRDLYNRFEVQEIFASRFINSDGNGRGKIRELLIRNRGTMRIMS